MIILTVPFSQYQTVHIIFISAEIELKTIANTLQSFDKFLIRKTYSYLLGNKF